MTRSLLLLLACAAFAASATYAQSVRVKDLVRVSSQRDNALVGYGIVTGLSGSGDTSRNKATRVSLANILARFDLAVSSDDIASRNVAVVMVTDALSAYAKPGDTVDVLVSSIGDARSLEGGALLMAPLKGADGRVYALAQGALTVGGYRHDANGNQVQKNHPTTGLVSGGGVIEATVGEAEVEVPETLTLSLASPDFNTAGRIADALNTTFGAELASVRDAGALEVQVPAPFRRRLSGFIRQIEGLMVEPDQRARVVISERTGAIVAGGDVRISPVAVAVGELKVTVTAENAVSQPQLLVAPNTGIRTETVTNSRLRVEETQGPQFVPAGKTRIADLVQLLAKAKTPTRDIIAILQAIKAAGALHAELIVQ